MLVSAWVPSSDFATPAKTVAELQAARISTAILMVNDFSDARGPTQFRTFDAERITTMANACHEAEILVGLCSWVMPHDLFVDGACDQLPALLADTAADLLMWDAEEPWTQAAGTFDRNSASLRLRDVFGYANMGLTAIGSAPAECWDLASVCSIWAPQAYATRDSKARPETVVPYSLEQWRRRYGEPSSWVIGLAGYDQASEAGATMWPPIDDCLAAELFDVCYWTSNAIASRPEVTAFVRCLSEPRRPHPGMLPDLDLASMPGGIYSRAVAEVQGLLMAWGCDPGPLDGKPGPKTVAAVRTFQRRKGLDAVGGVDAGTWSELLRP